MVASLIGALRVAIMLGLDTALSVIAVTALAMLVQLVLF